MFKKLKGITMAAIAFDDLGPWGGQNRNKAELSYQVL